MLRDSRRRGIFLLSASVILALITALLVYSTLSTPIEEEKVPVLIAKIDISAGQVVTSDMVFNEERSEDSVSGSYRRSFPLGEGWIAQANLSPGDIIREGDLAQMPLVLAPGMRAIALEVNNITGAGGTLQKGSRVDIIVSYIVPDETGEGSEQKVTDVLLEDVEVLDVGLGEAQLGGGILPLAGAQGEAGAANVQMVVLAVSLKQARDLTYVAKFGAEIRLVLRPPEDPVTNLPKLEDFPE